MVIPSLLDAAASLVNPVRFSLFSMLERIQVQAPSSVRLPGVPPCCPVPWGISCTSFTSATRDPVNSLSWRGQCGPPWCPFSHLAHLSTTPSPCPRTSSTLLVLERPEVRDNHQSPTREGWASLNFIHNSPERSSLDFERKKYLDLLYYSENAVKRGNRVSLWILRVPWIVRRSNQSIPKKINPEYSLEGLMLKLRYFGHLMQRADSLEKNLMLGKIEGKRRRGQHMGQVPGLAKPSIKHDDWREFFPFIPNKKLFLWLFDF